MKKLIPFFPAILFLIQQIVILPGCANIIPPEGGFRDSIPPLLVKASPLDSSKEFKTTRITLTFDEFVDLQNIHENLIISPIPQKEPDVEAHLRTVTVKLKDSLEANTTYSINLPGKVSILSLYAVEFYWPRPGK